MSCGDSLYAFLERNGNWLLPIAISWLLVFALGWGAALAAGAGTTGAVQFGASVLVWGGFVRGVVVFHITMSVNSFTHLWGYRSYQTNDNSKNNVFIGMLAAGEGWHNNHHADPRSARHGRRWWKPPTSPGSSSACSNGQALHGTIHAVATSCRGDGRSRSAVSSASDLHGVAPHASVTFIRCWRASRSPARAVLPRCRPRPAGRGRSPGT